MTIIEPEDAPVGVGVLLFIPYRHLEQRVLAAVAADGFDLTLAQARLLQRLDRQGSRLTALARAAQVSKQAAGFLVDELARGGYVERVADPTDGRARLIRIAARGRAAAEVAVHEQHRVEAEWEERIGPARMVALREALGDLRELTDR